MTVDAARELVITHPSVVNDARATSLNGPWTFAYLIRQMTPSKLHPSDFVVHWLSQWVTVTKINGFDVTPRTKINDLVQSWPKLQNGKLDLDKAPLRLLAIVNRLDVQVDGNVGEGRFVFGVLDHEGKPLPFTIIFEYNLPSSVLPKRFQSNPRRAWTQAWHELGKIPFGPEYNQLLEKITRSFSDRGTAPNAINKSSLAQIRTNEMALARPWELREFTLNSVGLLVQSPTKQTPAAILNQTDQTALVEWFKGSMETVAQEKHLVPQEFLGGSAQIPFKWFPKFQNGTTLERTARHKFGLNTCNGCHSLETRTAFMHIENRAADQESKISRFLTLDFERRRKDMEDVLCATSSFLRAKSVSPRVH